MASGGKDALTALYRERGWGEIGKVSYLDFLILLESTLNAHLKDQTRTDVETKIAELMALRADDPSNQPWRPEKSFVPPAPTDYTKLHEWVFPVHACGYNWLQDCAEGAKHLKDRIMDVIQQHNGPHSRCEQVILITHSMGGLVARACQKLKGMQAMIAGVVHGVMPADGAPVAYRRCKIGMADEDWLTSLVIGRTGQDVTAVFAQAPGALELLPTHNYKGGWLEVRGPDGKAVQKTLHESNPYDEIYRRHDRWWALVKEEWLAPEDGAPIQWNDYLKFIDKAEDFHKSLSPADYHPNTYAFYGADNRGNTRSFERLVWQMKHGEDTDALPPNQVYGLGASDKRVQLGGANPEFAGQRQIIDYADPTGSESVNLKTINQWELHASTAENSGLSGAPGMGDGTVPAASGRAPAACAEVRQVFRLSGVGHEPAYSEKSPIARQVTLYAISKIALEAKVPAAK